MVETIPKLKVCWKARIPSTEIASTRLRVDRPSTFLTKRRLICLEENPDSAQVVIYQKRFSEKDCREAVDLRRTGKRVVFDLCDNYFATYDSRTQKLLKTMIQSVDVTVVPTVEMKYVIEELISDTQVFVIPDMLEISQPQKPKQTNQEMRLVWFGNVGERNPPSGLYELSESVELKELERTIDASNLEKLAITGGRIALWRSGMSRRGWRYVRWHTNWFSSFGLRDLCYLPSLGNKVTLTKSPNRLLLAAAAGMPCYAHGNPAFDELKDLNIASSLGEAISTVAQLSASDLLEQIESRQQIVYALFGDEIVGMKWMSLFTHLYS